MTISIIVPTYNVEGYIEDCLQSIADQGYKGNIECIIVDDCGTDNSIANAKSFIAHYSGNIFFRIIQNESNKGLSFARNTGIKAAIGEWLYFLDSDDWIDPECIQRMMDCITAHPDTQIVCAGAKPTAQGFEWMDINKKPLPDYSNDRNWINKTFLSRTDLVVTSWNKLINKKFLTDNNLFFKEGIISEDEVWNFQLAKYVSSLSICKYNTYNYRVARQGSIISNPHNRDVHYIRLLHIFLDNITDPFRNRQISFVFTFLKIHFPNGIPRQYEKDSKIIKNRIISQAKGRQKVALFLFYNAPKCLVYNYHVIGRLLNHIGEV